MNNSTHIFQPDFQIFSSVRMRRTGKNIPEAAACLLMGILERLHLCHAPRIISAECLTDGERIVRSEV